MKNSPTEINYSEFRRTDAGNAELFAQIYRDTVRYDHKRRRWLVWEEHWWVPDDDGLITRLAKGTARARLVAATTIGDNFIREAEIKWATKSESAYGIKQTLSLAKAELPIADSGENWDSDPLLLGVANGVIDLRDGTLRDGKPDDRITMHVECEFHPDAQCPKWNKFLDETFSGDQAVISFIKRAVGYSLTGMTGEQCLFLCYGSGANGKSTFLETIRWITGDYSCTLPFSAFELAGRSSIPNDVAMLVSRRFVTAVETNEAVRLNEARIKALTGGDEISARFLHREFFSFRPTAKLWLAFNHKPIVVDDSEGFWRRIRLIPFTKQFLGSAANKELPGQLREESSGILNWAVTGCGEWIQSGLGMPPPVDEATRVYRKESDPVEAFLSERCVTKQDGWVSSADLGEAYKNWATDNPEYAEFDRRKFCQRLTGRGFEKKKFGKVGTRGWKGLALVDLQADT